MCVPPNTHLCSRIARTILFRREGRSHSQPQDTGQPTTKAALTFSDCALTSIPAQECMRQSSSLVKGKAALTLAWMACTLPAAPIPAQELTQATLFPLKRRPRSHFALSPTCSDRTRTAPLKNLDSSRVVGNYRTASAGVFTLNTHSRSRIWTVLDGEPYAAALRRRHW